MPDSYPQMPPQSLVKRLELSPIPRECTLSQAEGTGPGPGVVLGKARVSVVVQWPRKTRGAGSSHLGPESPCHSGHSLAWQTNF